MENRPKKCVVCGTVYDRERNGCFDCPDCGLSVCGWHAGMNQCCGIKKEMNAQRSELTTGGTVRNFTVIR